MPCNSFITELLKQMVLGVLQSRSLTRQTGAQSQHCVYAGGLLGDSMLFFWFCLPKHCWTFEWLMRSWTTADRDSWPNLGAICLCTCACLCTEACSPHLCPCVWKHQQEDVGEDFFASWNLPHWYFWSFSAGNQKHLWGWFNVCLFFYNGQSTGQGRNSKHNQTVNPWGRATSLSHSKV